MGIVSPYTVKVNILFTIFSDLLKMHILGVGLLYNYDNKEIADRIKELAKEKNIPITRMLNDLGLGVNMVSELSKGRMVSCYNMAQIADYLNCSVDYLMGRTSVVGVTGNGENPVIKKTIEIYIDMNRNGKLIVNEIKNRN